MSLENRLREHFTTTAGRLDEPPARVEAVVRRGRRRRRLERGAVLAAAALVLVAVPVALRTVPRTTVELEPAGPPAEPEPAPASPPESPVGIDELGARVVAYGPYEHDFLWLRGGGEPDEQVGGPTDVALPDGAGGLVVQQSGLHTIAWQGQTLAEGDEGLLLRAVLPDGRIVYSQQPSQNGYTEDSTEEFYAVALSEGAEPEHIASRPAYESWHVGPAVSAAGPVHAGCHLHCAIRPGLATPPPDAEAVYEGAAIDGLTATPDGRIVGFVEYQTHEEPAPELVLLDGSSFAELARIRIPLADGEQPESPVVSLSADAGRNLVTLGVAPHLVEDALGDSPTVLRVDSHETLRWMDPAAAEVGGAATAHPAVERLVAFAREAGADTFADVPFADEVWLGLGPHLVARHARSELSAPELWAVHPPGGLFRGSDGGPWSALERLAGQDLVVSEGPRDHCAGPPPDPVPEELSGLRHVHVQPSPATYDSCLQWWVVDVFLDEGGDVAAVTLDFWEP